MSGGDFLRYQRINQGLSGTMAINTTGATGTTIISGGTGSASGAIFVQTLEVVTTTGSTGVTWDFQGSSGSLSISGLLPMNTAPASVKLDFGAQGVQLTTGSNFQIVTSGTGAAGIVTWQGYKKYMGGMSVGFFPASGSSGTTP